MSDENKPSEPKDAQLPQSEETPAQQVPTPTAPVTSVPSLAPNEDQWLWVDPYLDVKDPSLLKRATTGSVLLAEDIIRYISHYNVLIDRDDFNVGEIVGAKLKGASYTMTPDDKGAWIYLPTEPNGEAHQETMLPKKDDVGDYYLIPKNSLVYVKIRQRLRIPFYIIGRHNLKIRYVYQGLLLGTGPQVDPGFCGNLFIPLHNFTTRDVKLYTKQSFISIDFTRTSELSFAGQAVPQSLDDFYKRFEKEKHLLERTKVTERTNITKYLEGATPRSQMGQFQYDFGGLEKKVKQEFEKIEKTLRQMVWERLAVVISLVSFLIVAGSLIYTSLNYYRGFVADFKSETERTRNIAANTNIASIENRVLSLESNGGVSSIAVSNLIKTQVSNQLASQQHVNTSIIMSQDELDVLRKVYERYQTNITNSGGK